MSPRRMLLYDIPDGDQLVHQYLDELRQEYPPISYELVLEHLKEVAYVGWLITGCKPVGQGLFKLDVPIGYAKVSRILFFETPKGDFMALHAFTLDSGNAADRGFAVAAQRKRDLM